MLQDKPHRNVVRIGDTVRRPLQPWSASVHELLLHLEAIGFPYTPRVRGIDDGGREVLTYIDGESGTAGWAKVVDERGLGRVSQRSGSRGGIVDSCRVLLCSMTLPGPGSSR